MEEKDGELTTEYSDGLSGDVAVSEPSPDTAEATSCTEKKQPEEPLNEEQLEREPAGEEASEETEDGQPADEPREPQTEQPAEEQTKEQSQMVAPPPKKKRGARIFWNIFLIVVIAAGIWSLFGIVGEIDSDKGAPFEEVIANASPLFMCVLILAVLAGMALDVSKFCIISKTVTGRVNFVSSLKVNFIGRYYDAVTPFSTGGQPMQIYYLNTKGISGGNSSAMVLIRYFSSIICWMLVGGSLMIAGACTGVLDGVSEGAQLLKITGWIGIAVNLIVPMFILLFLVLPKLMQKLTAGIVKIGYKLKIVKDIDKTTARATKIVYDFKHSFKLMATSPLKLILLILVCLTESAITFAMPYFVMKAFNCPVDSMVLSIMSLNAFTTFGVSFVPTPGNSGVVEGLGALAFSQAAGATLVWSVLTWRLSVFYVYIFIGLIITVYDVIAKNVRYKRTLSK